jgi:radical SAM superfamily enzyme YgiQ (UPF0313 family)
MARDRNGLRTKRYGDGAEPRRILLVAPRSPPSFWSMQGTVELFGAKSLMPNAALPTLMALTPPGVDVEYSLCDENTSELDWSRPCDLAAVTGSTLHAGRIVEICRGFASRGVEVALGGTYATIRAEECAGLADHLFVGEAEHTWPRFLAEWRVGAASPRYVQEEPVDLAASPAPDWSLVDPRDHLHLPVQTSRGCPNRCDFCDVIQLHGRRYRTKSVEQILVEVRRLHALGARSLFFSDDNFLGRPAFTRELLSALVEWNREQAHPLAFSTQIPVTVGDDEDLLRLLADARFSVLFLGVETVRRESLEEVHKTHNLSRDLAERIRRISRFGLVPFVGLIVGFDHDDAAVFGELERFLDEAAAPIAGVSLLNAPRRTPLHERLSAEGRLVGDDFAGEWQYSTNIVPLRMSREELERGYRDLFRSLYDPERFEARLEAWCRLVAYRSTIYTRRKKDLLQIFRILPFLWYCFFQADRRVRKMFLRVLRRTLRTDPSLMKRIFTFLGQFRHFYDFAHRGPEPRGLLEAHGAGEARRSPSHPS